MCGRYEIDVQPEKLVDRFKLSGSPPESRGCQIRPGNRALVINADRQPLLRSWGLRVSWNNQPLINARAETLAGKKSFRPWLENRCLVPASAYFEWRKEGKAKLKNRIGRKDGEPIAFAGLMDRENFTIITCRPVPAIARIHNRMPVILKPQAEGMWLDGTLAFGEAAAFLVPFDDSPLKAEEEVATGYQPDLFRQTRP